MNDFNNLNDKKRELFMGIFKLIDDYINSEITAYRERLNNRRPIRSRRIVPQTRRRRILRGRSNIQSSSLRPATENLENDINAPTNFFKSKNDDETLRLTQTNNSNDVSLTNRQPNDTKINLTINSDNSTEITQQLQEDSSLPSPNIYLETSRPLFPETIPSTSENTDICLGPVQTNILEGFDEDIGLLLNPDLEDSSLGPTNYPTYDQLMSNFIDEDEIRKKNQPKTIIINSDAGDDGSVVDISGRRWSTKWFEGTRKNEKNSENNNSEQCQQEQEARSQTPPTQTDPQNDQSSVN